MKEISASEARGNSRAVSSDEFQSLATEGQRPEAGHALQADRRPATAVTDPEKWAGVKSSAYAATRDSWGGQTIDPQTGKPITPSTGYALTIRDPGHSQITVSEHALAEDRSSNRAMDDAKSQYAKRINY